MINKIFASILLLAVMATGAFAQTELGFYEAADYGKWVFRSETTVAAGAATFTVRGDAFATTPGGKTFYPLATNAPILVDQEDLSVDEVVTPTAVTCNQNSLQSTCTVTATFASAHTAGFTVRSATYGLCEARNNVVGTGTVAITHEYAGSTSTVTSATLGGACDSTSINILDTRNGAFTRYTSNGTVYDANIGAKNGATVTAVENGNGVIQHTVLTLTATPVAVTDALAYADLKIYDFPEGRILFLGSTGSLAFTTTSTIASTINSAANMDWALGTVAASNITLATTMLDLLAKVDNPTSTTINVAAAATTGALAASAQFDGTSTAKDMFLNVSFPTDTEIDADGTLTVTGTIKFSWINLGDF